MRLKSLQDMFLHELGDIYSAEKQILHALPTMIRSASSGELSAALEEHRQITEDQVDRLEQVFSMLEESPRTSKKCKGMEGLLEEGSEMVHEDADDAARDAGIIAIAQKVEHYEIAAYGTLVAYARLLDQHKAADLLEETLNEEKDADERLTEIAMSVVNISAQEASERPIGHGGSHDSSQRPQPGDGRRI